MGSEVRELKGVELSWKDVTFEVPLAATEAKALKKNHQDNLLPGKPATHKLILSQVSGRLAPGSFTAIMGASGSGKTTLLNFLSNRKYYLRTVKTTGTVCLNGHGHDDLPFNQYVAYVMQDDTLIECMTVRELLTFTAKMRLQSSKWENRMLEVVEQLELTKILNSRIGGLLTRGISGGERKRVAIAMEILNDPFVLFLDEPTTGLDSYNAENVVSMCVRLSKMGKTVCCTIHQPNSFIFSLFDQLMILGDKKIIFNGYHNDAVQYFGAHGFVCPTFMNPAEHIVNVLSDKSSAAKFPHVIDTGIVEIRDLPKKTEKADLSLWMQFALLTRRSYTNYIRNRLMLTFKIAYKVFLAFIFLTSFWMIADAQDRTSVSDRAGFLIFFLSTTSFDAMSAVGSYNDEKAQYIREQANCMYSPFIYFLSKLISELPLDTVLLIIFQAAVYSGVGFSLENAEQIFIFILVNLIVFTNGKGWCFILIFGLGDLELASSVMPVVLIGQMLFGGLFINFSKIPKYLYEFEYTSIFKFTWSAVMLNEFDTFDKGECGDYDECDAKEFYSIELTMWENIAVAIAITILVNLTAGLLISKISKAYRE